MQTFRIQTLGCKVNHYESEQVAALLKSLGLTQIETGPADLRIINTCSVTMEAASKSRQSVRRAVQLPVLSPSTASDPRTIDIPSGSRVVVTGCWATSNPGEAQALSGVDAVLTHHQDVSVELKKLISQWQAADESAGDEQHISPVALVASAAHQDNGWIKTGGNATAEHIQQNKPHNGASVKKKLAVISAMGTRNLPLLIDRQSAHQRAFLKIQDGCDAHCTYCIIPSLRPSLWSKPADQVLLEAKQLIDAGHVEIVLTGIFLSAYGRSSALRRRQVSEASPLAGLIDLLCTEARGLRRLRLSSLEPGDLDDELIAVLKSHPQIVPHFHLPLQSGSDRMLHRMNRQYTRDDFLRMVDRVEEAFDRPALTTDIIAGFPGESDEDFERTIDVVNRARFIHIHAFPYSPRPGTAAARWSDQFVKGNISRDRINQLETLADGFSLDFRRAFIGKQMNLLVEREGPGSSGDRRHGRCERYFDIEFDGSGVATGDLVSVVVDEVLPDRTKGAFVEVLLPNPSGVNSCHTATLR